MYSYGYYFQYYLHTYRFFIETEQFQLKLYYYSVLKCTFFISDNLEVVNSSTGPVDECCKKPCKLRDLKAYCMDSR